MKEGIILLFLMVLYKYNVTGYQNIAIGENALNDNSTGFYNIALGVQAMTENTTGASNIGLGYQVFI